MNDIKYQKMLRNGEMCLLNVEAEKSERKGITSVNRALSHQNTASFMSVQVAAEALGEC